MIIFLIKGGINTLVDVDYDSSEQRMICKFMNQPPETLKQCNASITSGVNCDLHHEVYHITGIGETLLTPSIAIDGFTEFCFSVNTSSGNVTVIVEGRVAVDVSKFSRLCFK